MGDLNFVYDGRISLGVRWHDGRMSLGAGTMVEYHWELVYLSLVSIRDCHAQANSAACSSVIR